MKSFKTVPNNSHKVRFPWEVANSQSFNIDLLQNDGLVDFSEFSPIRKASLLPTSVVVSSNINEDKQAYYLVNGIADIQNQKNTDNVIPFLLTNLLTQNIHNISFLPENRSFKKSPFFDDYRSELEQFQPIHAVVNSNLDSHENTADTVISRTIVEVSKNPETQLDETKVKNNMTVVFAETLQNNSTLDLLEIYGIVDQALRDSYDYLSKFRFDPEYSQKLETAFGTDFNREVADKLFNNFSNKNFTNIPTIKIVNRADIYGGNAAFSADTGLVYLAVEFLTENYKNPSIITDVLLEETGHFVDSHINKIDSPGDEGEIFANLVQGNLLSEQELQALKSENDIATVISSNQGITVISGQSAINVEQNVKPLRVATWNIWNEGGAQANNTIEGIKRRINYIARFGMATDIDVIALQEIKNPGTDPLANALQAYKNNNALPGTYTRDGLAAMLNGYDFIVATSENNPNNPQNTPNSTDGYLILFNPNTITMGNAGFFSPGTFSGIANNSTYYLRPPYEVNIQYKQTNKAYKILTWHNEYQGGQLGAQARFTGMQRLKEGLQSLQANSPTIVLGDFNVRPNEIQQKSEINLFAQGYTGANSAEYDYILANPQGARVAQFGLTIENSPQLTSDAHTALFAEIDGREPVRRTV
ncbi:endonuclease/exonuclease/phosphatase family protein, partial [Dolichospermum sp. ST_sed9]|nr:endonuclease/exonuclease/phosphatase family protein [Dolichospermum sp. ST_sed9]